MLLLGSFSVCCSCGSVHVVGVFLGVIIENPCQELSRTSSSWCFITLSCQSFFCLPHRSQCSIWVSTRESISALFIPLEQITSLSHVHELKRTKHDSLWVRLFIGALCTTSMIAYHHLEYQRSKVLVPCSRFVRQGNADGKAGAQWGALSLSSG